MESLEALFEYATEGIIIANKSGVIVRANPSSEKLFGYDKDELINQRIEVLVPQKYSHSHVQKREGYNHNPHPRSMGDALGDEGPSSSVVVCRGAAPRDGDNTSYE